MVSRSARRHRASAVPSATCKDVSVVLQIKDHRLCVELQLECHAMPYAAVTAVSISIVSLDAIPSPICAIHPVPIAAPYECRTPPLCPALLCPRRSQRSDTAQHGSSQPQFKTLTSDRSRTPSRN